MEVDLNCDLGEGAAFDAEIMPLVTSANVCCAAHAGSPEVSFRTLQLAKEHGVAVGAHPGHADREHFGRRELPWTPERIYQECVYQIGALHGLASAARTSLRYVKPHGGLYHQAGNDPAIADSVIAVCELFKLPVIGLPGSELQKRSANRVPFFAEGFADRRYLPDGTLAPRDRPGAFIENANVAVEQVEWLLGERGVRTICVHGDNPQALHFIRVLREALQHRRIRIAAFA